MILPWNYPEFAHHLGDTILFVFGALVAQEPLLHEPNPRWRDTLHFWGRVGLGIVVTASLAEVGKRMTVEGILGSSFSGRIVAELEEHGHPAVVVEVEGRAWVTGRHTFFMDSEDPCLEGFLL